MDRILIVEDNPDNLETLHFLLDVEGFSTFPLADARRIDHAIATFSPELILMDVMLGTANGIDICNALKAAPATRHIPVVLLSASTILGTLGPQNCLADGLIEKPYNIQELLTQVKELIAKSGP